ncbi:MAG: glycosyltransferase family 39 protein [Acidobacteriota bacterium]|nr:glycosyltransferase family 39 protein [Acidobacteriota bacterium]
MTEKEKKLTQSEHESKRIRLMAGALFLIGALTRLAFLAWRGPTIAPDSNVYLGLARNLLQHATFSQDAVAPLSPSVRWAPLYPAFIAALSWTGNPSPLAIATTQSVLGAVTVVMLLFLARTVLPLKWALAVGLVYALHPGPIYSASTILTETLFTALLVGSVLSLSFGLKRNSLWLTALSGILMGLAILSRPIALPLPLILFAVILPMRSLRRRVLHGLLFSGMALLLLIPWSIRSSYIAGKFVLVQDSSVVGQLFYTATRWDWDQKDQSTLWPKLEEESRKLAAAEAERSVKANESHETIHVDQVLFRDGIRNVLANPGQYVVSRARQFPYLFITSYDSFTGIENTWGTLWARRDLLRLSVKFVMLVLFSLVPFLLALLGLITIREHLTSALCAAVWLFVLVFHIPLWVEPRYWLHAIPFLLISAALGAEVLWRVVQKRRSGIVA